MLHGMMGLLVLFQPLALPPGHWVDLTHAFSKDTIYWPTADGFELEVLANGYTDQGYFYSANNFRSAEHGGTHLDAPVHFSEGKHSTDQIPLESLIGSAVVIDVSSKALRNRDYRVSINDFRRFERVHGRIPAGSIVLIRTGYAQFWPDPEKYLGTSEKGEAALPKLHFPGIHPNLARWLVASRSIKAIGLDTPSIDYGQTQSFESHQILYQENIPAFENVASLDQLPPTGAFVVALPMKIEGGSGGPLRIVALIPE